MRKIPYEKSLEYCNPALAEEWHPTKNGDLKPSEVATGSRRRVWWYLKYNDPKTKKIFEFEWEASILSRTQGTGCPYLSGKKIFVGFNDLFSTNPEYREIWNYELNRISPYDVTKSSNEVVWWKCEFGHSWEQQIASIVRHKSKCPICTGRKLIVGVNDLATMRKDLVAEWNYKKNKYIPEQYKATSKKKVWWICEKGHEWEARIAARTLNKRNCPYCSGYKVTEENSIKSLYPELLEEWDYEKNKYIRPEECSPGSEKKVHWICKEGHEWMASISNRTRHKSGCPYCCGNLAIPGVTDLKTKCPELMEEWNYDRNININPETITFRSHKKVWWICKKGHEWRATPHNRARGYGCPVCHRSRN